METTSIYGFLKRPSLVDFPGKVSAVFFSSGCNFRCGFCHNAELLKHKKNGITPEKLQQTVDDFRIKHWVDGVVITGGEPTLCPDLPEIVRFFRSQGLAVKLDTNGSAPHMLRTLLPELDYVAMDVKSSLENYPKIANYEDISAIQSSIRLINQASTQSEFRTTIIESFHNDEEMRAIGRLISLAKRYVLQPFLPREDLPDPKLSEEPRTSPDRMNFLGKMMQAYAEEVIVKGAIHN